MTDIKAIAATYAARIFDRMELCRGSAMLKSDIEREVEMALRDANVTADHKPTPDFLINPYLMWTDPTNGDIHCFEASEDMNEFVAAKRKRIDRAVLITPEEAEKRSIPLGAPGYVWVGE